MRRCFLASRGLGALPAFLGGAGGRAVWVPTAANPLPDRDAVIAGARRDLRVAGLAPPVVDLDAAPPADVAGALGGADTIILTGGDPFYLLDRLRVTGAGDAVVAAVARGVPFVGVSAGAIVAGPSLEPHVLTSPLVPRPGLDLRGLGLVGVAVLPHHDREGRAARHEAAAATLGDRFALLPLRDDEAVVVEDAACVRMRS